MIGTSPSSGRHEPEVEGQRHRKLPAATLQPIQNK